MKKNNSLPIESVTFEYVGTDKQFNEFLRSVIHDYVSDDKTLPQQEPQDIWVWQIYTDAGRDH